MTTVRAVEVLNQYWHRGFNKWEIASYEVITTDNKTGAVENKTSFDTIMGKNVPADILSAFEAIAIAEKYLTVGYEGPSQPT